MGETLGRATYDIESDRLYFYPAEKLEEEIRERLNKAGFLWAPTAVRYGQAWTIERKNLLLELLGGGEIEEDEADKEELFEAKIERLESAADHAAERSAAAWKASDLAVAGIEPGQPILEGHHSEGPHRRALERSWRKMGESIEEGNKAEYYRRKAARAISRAEKRETPGAIYRRIKDIKARIVSCKNRARDDTASAWYMEWIEHYNLRLGYELALLEASGGLPAINAGDLLQIGARVRCEYGLLEVLKINKSKGEISSVRVKYHHGDFNLSIDRITEVVKK